MLKSLGVLKGRRVLLTGHTGFKGAWMAVWLNRLGAELHGYALPAAPDGESVYAAAKVKQLLASETLADLRDRATLTTLVRAMKPDAVLHLAGQSGVLASYQSPLAAFDVNVQGTAHLLEAVRELRAPCAVICAGADRAFDNGKTLTAGQKGDVLNGHDPYSASKAAAEILIAAYRHAFFHPAALESHRVQLASARAGCVMGGGDWSGESFVTEIIEALLAGRSAAVGSPLTARPWQHVLDPLAGCLTLLAAMLARPSAAWCDSWNFGPMPGHDVAAGQLAEAFAKAWSPGDGTDEGTLKAYRELLESRAVSEKPKSPLEWYPRWPWDVAVLRTARWYRQACGENADGRALCLSDIDAFTAC